jgi:tetratricopeptide (TPR) repeat protein
LTGLRAAVWTGWAVAVAAAVGVRAWNALAGSLMWGYDAWGHVAYVLFLDLYRAVPWADQGWSYFHPPLHYVLGWVLAQFGSGDVLMRGLSLLGGAASLGTAALAAQLVRMTSPGRSALALLAFTAVAFLPVHLFMSPMPGNEMTLTLLSAAALVAFIANESRPRPRRSADALCGALIGLALLTKFNGLLPLLVICAALASRPAFAEDRRGELRRSLARGALIAGIALVIAFPYYARNIRAFGTPFQLSRDYPLIAQVEDGQPPGQRALSDYFRITPRMFSEPNPLAPHMLHSIWGTVYLNVWADIFRESDVSRALDAERSKRPSTRWMALLGLFPTALALLGAALATRDAWQGRRRSVYVPLLLLAGATLASFSIFAWRVPIWSALKASYLLGLSLPYGVFVARAIESFAGRGPIWLRAGPPALFGAVSALAAVIALEGVVLPRRADAPATGAVRFYFGEYEAASRVYGRLVVGAGYKAPWLDNLAAVNLLDGHPDRARRFYARAVATGLPDPYRRGRLAVAAALDGDPGAARVELDAALAERRLPELLANRGAVRALLGDLAGAEADLRDALALSSGMVPAWRNLSLVLTLAGRPQDGERARQRAEREACTPPRGYPYGLGTGEVLEWGVGRRWLLLLEGDRLRAATPSFYRDMCAALGREGGAAAADALGAS